MIKKYISMDYEQLKQCYNKILQKYSSLKLDSWNVVKTVHNFRQFWKPNQVKVILLAESHFYTENFEWEILLKPNHCLPTDYPRNFVRFVYCVAYGENDLLDHRIAKNSGTWQYWELLYSCLNDVKNNNWNFSPILKGGTRDKNQRVENKIQLLNRLKESGIWLVDASIVGINRVKNIKIRKGIIELCWDNYICNLIAQTKPNHVILIGNTVKSVIFDKLKTMSVKCSCRPQPQKRGKREVHLDSYKHYFDVCNRYTNYTPKNLNEDNDVAVYCPPSQKDLQGLSVIKNNLIHKLSTSIIPDYKWTIDLKLGYYSAHIKKASECTVCLRSISNNVIENVGSYKLDLDGLLKGGFVKQEDTSKRLRIIMHYDSNKYFIYRNKKSACVEIPL